MDQEYRWLRWALGGDWQPGIVKVSHEDSDNPKIKCTTINGGTYPQEPDIGPGLHVSEALTEFFDPCKVGSEGFVRLVDVMGDQSSIVQAARVSYGKGTKTKRSDVGLIRYLMRHRHTTPLEMCEIKLHVRVPMDIWRQWIRHRTANVNEYSTRYSEAIDKRATTEPDAWRSQSRTNKQGSGGMIPDEWDEAEILALGDAKYNEVSRKGMKPGDWLTYREQRFHEIGTEVYRERLAFGVAREQARKDLPLSTYTEAYWKIDLHNLLHFLALRLNPHAQKEIREYAAAIAAIVEVWLPDVWEAFTDYRLNAHTFSGPEMEAIRAMLGDFRMMSSDKKHVLKAIADRHELGSQRERKAFWKALGVIE